MNLHHLKKWAMALLLIGVAAGSTGMSILARSAPPESEQRTEAMADENRYRVTMAGGATFEVVAVSNHYGSPKTWWRPDGSPLNDAPVDRSQDAYFGIRGQVLLDIVVRVKGLPDDSTLKWVPAYDGKCLTYLGGGDRSGGGVKQHGQSAPDLRAYVASFLPDRTNCSVQIQYAAGPWKTEANDQVRFGGGTLIKDGHEFHFGHAHSCQGGTAVAVAHNLTDAGIHTRLMALDHLGKEHPAVRYADAAAHTAHSFVNHFGKEHPAHYSSGSRREVFSMLDAEFAMPPDSDPWCPRPVAAVRTGRDQGHRFETAPGRQVDLEGRVPRTAVANPALGLRGQGRRGDGEDRH